MLNHSMLRCLLATLIGCLLPTAARAQEHANLNDAISLVPVQYRHRLVQQLSLAENNSQQWLDAIARAQPAQREGVAFLLVNMPERDLKSLTGDFLLHDVSFAYAARAKFPWAAAVPNEIFLNDVLPYANLNEKRDDWREDFFTRFGPLVKDCKSASDAAQVLNREVFKQLNVKYHATKRLKPDQSPRESINIHYASCSGLSILLADACRSVGVPARVTGTPLWIDKSGNHTWVEVWDGQWRFTGAAEPGEWNKTWFAALAAKADDSKPEHRIYAASFQRTDLPFLLIWDPKATDYSAVDVTGYYVHRQKLTVNFPHEDHSADKTAIEVRRDGQLIAFGHGPSASFELAANTPYEVQSIPPHGDKSTKPVTLPANTDAVVELSTSRG